MKKILMIMLCLALLLGSAMAEVNAMPGSPAEDYIPAPVEKLGFELLKELYVSGENSMLSPQSLALALGMAAEGAQGDTLAEILAALDVQDVQQIAARLPEGIQSANAVFTAPGLALNADYADRLAEAYAAERFEIDAGVVEKVNSWVKENTDGMIDGMLSQAPGADVGMMLLNAVAMDAKWVHSFNEFATADDAFYAPSGKVKVPMMHLGAMLDYAEKDGVQIVRLPYQEGGLEMWIAMPEKGGMDALLDTLQNEGMFYLVSDAQPCQVELAMPKVDISDDHTLTAALKALGIETAFDGEKADFSGISDTGLCIDDVLQKNCLQINEQGTRAAAVTMMVMKTMMAIPEEVPVEMNVNRPFAFVISDGETGSVCFAGVIENPAKN